MPHFFFVWNDQIIDHLAEHEISTEEFEQVVCNPLAVRESRSSGRPVAFGVTEGGRQILCIYELFENDTVLPITAYEVQ